MKLALYFFNRLSVLLCVIPMSLSAALFVWLYSSANGVQICADPERFLEFFSLAHHNMLPAFIYTPSIVTMLYPLLSILVDAKSISRLGGISAVQRWANAHICVAAGLFSVVLLGTFVFLVYYIFSSGVVAASFYILLILNYILYALECGFILCVSYLYCRKKLIACSIVIAYGLIPYFLGMSPLIQNQLIHFGWMLVTDIQISVFVAATATLRHIL